VSDAPETVTYVLAQNCYPCPGTAPTRIAVRNTYSIETEAGQQAFETIAEWMGLPHHKSRSESCTKGGKSPSEFTCEFCGEFSCDFYQCCAVTP
jgi:hypothetical protein